MPVQKSLTVVKDNVGTNFPSGTAKTVDLTCEGRENHLSTVLLQEISGIVQEVQEYSAGAIAVTKIVNACDGTVTYVREPLNDVLTYQSPCCAAGDPVVQTPIPPTVIGNDTTDILTASHSLGASEILVSENGGVWTAYAGPISVGNVARASGYWQFKIKAAPNRNESAVASSPAFTENFGQLATPVPQADQFSNDGLGFRIFWPQVPNATGYDIQVSTTSNFTTIIADTAQNEPTREIQFSGGQPGNTYYFRVRAKAPGYTTSAWGTAQATTLTTFDTVLTFVNSTSGAPENAKESVGGTVSATNATQKFEFNKIINPTGTPASMNINVSGSLEIVIDYLNDYNNTSFRYTDIGGIVRTGVFTNGVVNF